MQSRRRALFIYAASLVLMAGLFTSANAQTRALVSQTTIYSFQGDRVAQGAIPGSNNTFFVTYAGQIQSLGNRGGIAVRSYSLTLFYTKDAKNAYVTGGQWTLTTVREQIGSSVGGTITAGTTIPFDQKGTLTAKGLIFGALGETSLGPTSGFFSAEIDKGTKIKGTLTLTYLVIV
jgi:hypothetical protein